MNSSLRSTQQVYRKQLSSLFPKRNFDFWLTIQPLLTILIINISIFRSFRRLTKSEKAITKTKLQFFLASLFFSIFNIYILRGSIQRQPLLRLSFILFFFIYNSPKIILYNTNLSIIQRKISSLQLLRLISSFIISIISEFIKLLNLVIE